MRALPRAYSHRDCELRPPLWRSLWRGFSHIEADAYALLGRVYVAHDPQRLRPWKTLEKLYLEPLRRHLEANGGRVFADDTPLWLYVDFKTPARVSYRALERSLEPYADILTSFTPTGMTPGPVTIIVSGERMPYAQMRGRPLRYAALDGRLEDVGVHTDPLVMPVISDHWGKHFRWRGEGPMPEEERARLERLLAVTHAQGQKLRFWATPDADTPERQAVWDELLTLGIDLVNTDDIDGLAEYLSGRQTAR